MKSAPAKERCIHSLFERQVERTPDSVAVSFGHQRLTYAELDRKANQVAHYLRSFGVGTESLVGICVERSLKMIISLLGILKAGAAYLPLDSSYPKQRLSYMLNDSKVSILITQRKISPNLPDHNAMEICLESDWEAISALTDRNPPNEMSEANAAYVIYTSGSTGQPKGVIGLHGATINRCNWMWESFPFSTSDVCCQKTNLSFVDSVWEIFGPLLAGAPTVIIPDEEAKDPHLLAEAMAKYQVSRIVLTPSLLRAILEKVGGVGKKVSNVKLWVSSGEALGTDLSKVFKQELIEARLLNLYGSSEVAADASWHEVCGDERGGTVAIGKPISNIRMYVIDNRQQAVTGSADGELTIAGKGLARGYLNRADLTAERFLPDPFSDEEGARMYRTGDLVKRGLDGEMDYLGRRDHQVKIRGNRVELGEVEAALREHESVADSVVVARAEPGEELRLVGYVVIRQEQDVSLSELRKFVKGRLPDYMSPAILMKLEKLPLNPNGKVDRLSLPKPEVRDEEMERRYAEPRSDLEKFLAGIWAEALKVERVGIHDEFFDLGGHSLLATEILAWVREAFDLELPLRIMFEGATIANLARTIVARESVAGQMEKVAQVILKVMAMSEDDTNPHEKHK